MFQVESIVIDDTVCFTASLSCPMCKGNGCGYCDNSGEVEFTGDNGYLIPVKGWIDDSIIADAFKSYDVLIFEYNDNYYMVSLPYDENYAKLCKVWLMCGIDWLPISWIELLVKYEDVTDDLLSITFSTIGRYKMELDNLASKILQRVEDVV
jgi:hypothetical protein